jgi:hypothetical protein
METAVGSLATRTGGQASGPNLRDTMAGRWPVLLETRTLYQNGVHNLH